MFSLLIAFFTALFMRFFASGCAEMRQRLRLALTLKSP